MLFSFKGLIIHCVFECIIESYSNYNGLCISFIIDNILKEKIVLIKWQNILYNLCISLYSINNP